MRYKILSKDQIIITLDRLTRFKNTKEKYLRVFTDILISCLIEPKLKKTDIENLDYETITKYINEIFNSSIEEHLSDNFIFDNCINSYIKNYENKIFINDKEVEKLLDNNINYELAVNIISDDCSVNLKWLKQLVKNKYNLSRNNICKLREKYMLKFPLEKIILVEGITEEILLPVFAKFLNCDFYANGIQIIAAGGKNQVVKKYYELSKQLKLPIFILLDKDAEENIKQIQPRLRKNDIIHLVSCGEFEDLLPKKLIVKTINSHFKNFLKITEVDLDNNISTVKILEEMFKRKGLHEFKKAEFAKLVRDEIAEYDDISNEIKDIIKEILNINKKLDTKLCS